MFSVFVNRCRIRKRVQSLEFEDAPLPPPNLLSQVRSSSPLTAPKVPARFPTLETFTPFSLHRARRIPGFRTAIHQRGLSSLSAKRRCPTTEILRDTWSRRQRKRSTATPQDIWGWGEGVLTSHSAHNADSVLLC